MTKPLYDVPTMCGIMGCLKTRPCPEHGRKAWTGTTPRTRGRRGQTMRQQAKRAAGGKCALCPMPGAEVDHITPLSRGGADDLGNMQLLCSACHEKKTSEERRARNQKLKG